MVSSLLINHGNSQAQTDFQQGTFGQEVGWLLHHFGVIMTSVKKEQ